MSDATDHQLLISRRLNGTITSEEFAILSAWVKRDSANAKELALAAMMHRWLIDRLRGHEPVYEGRSLHDSMIVPAIRIAEESDEFDELAALLPAPPAISAPAMPAQVKSPPRGPFHSLWHWRGAAILLLAVAGLVAIVAVLHHPHSAATLLASVDAKWEQGEHAKGDAFAIGSRARLISGFAELHFTGGATVIAEGPAEIVMRSGREMYLSSGKVFANVPGGGFVVSTAVGTITDLGTEFGVSVSAPDQCEVAVFKGKVQVDLKAQSQDGPAAARATASNVLVEGQAASLSSTSMTQEPSSAISQRFTRTLEAGVDSLDMVDLVAGGDGTTHRRGAGIDASGKWGKLAPGSGVTSDGLYHRIPGLATVDGVFIPEGGSLPTQLDSAGDSFVFPGVLGTSHQQIWAGGPFPGMHNRQPIPYTLAGVDYSTPGHGFLLLHGARGLTFDLNAIRRLHPDRRIAAFRCLIGNTYAGPAIVQADAWVFTDGRQRFFAHNFTSQEKPHSVSIAVTDTDHFLTLVTGYPPGPASHDNSWVIAADPVLELQPR